RFLRSAKPTSGGIGLAALAVGGAHLCKFTALLLWPVLVVMGVCAVLRDVGRWRRVVVGLIACGLATWIVINVIYGFGGSFRRLDSYRFQAHSTAALQKLLPGATPVPLPATYVEGFDVQKAEVELGVPAFLNG